MLTWISSTVLADVDLVTIPTREGVQLTIYNSEDITMVREHRLLTVKPGINRIQFTWAATLIDPTSIDFRILGHVDTTLIHKVYSHFCNDDLVDAMDRIGFSVRTRPTPVVDLGTARQAN